MLQMRVDLILTLSKRFFWLFSFLREKERNAASPPRLADSKRRSFGRFSARRSLDSRRRSSPPGKSSKRAGCRAGRRLGCCVFVALFLDCFPRAAAVTPVPGSRKARNWLGMWRSLQSIYGTSSSSMACGARQAIAIAGSSMIRLRSKGSLQPHA